MSDELHFHRIDIAVHKDYGPSLVMFDFLSPRIKMAIGNDGPWLGMCDKNSIRAQMKVEKK